MYELVMKLLKVVHMYVHVNYTHIVHVCMCLVNFGVVSEQNDFFNF